MEGRGHHMVKFHCRSVDPKTLTNGNFKSDLPTWTPTHGSVGKWDHKILDESSVGLLIPRAWWTMFWFLPIRIKLGAFYIEGDESNFRPI